MNKAKLMTERGTPGDDEDGLERKAYGVLELAGRLAHAIEDLKRAHAIEEERSSSHALIRARTAEHVLRSVEEVLTADRMVSSAMEAFPEIAGEVELAFRTGLAAERAWIVFDAGDESAFEGLIPEEHLDSVRLRAFDTGIGAGGVSILLTFVREIGVSLAATAIYESVKAIRDRGFEPRISEQAAIAICQAEALKSGVLTTIGPSYATRPRAVRHADYEVVLCDSAGKIIARYLVRPNGEICGNSTS